MNYKHCLLHFEKYVTENCCLVQYIFQRLFYQWVSYVYSYQNMWPLQIHISEQVVIAVKVMGTIASQLKALSQNTPQSSIIL